jgi:arsenate reductase
MTSGTEQARREQHTAQENYRTTGKHCYSSYRQPVNATKYEDIMSITIYHNPRCSKSRKTLQLLEESGVSPRIVDYLDTPPAAATTLRLASLIGVPVAALLRRGEAEFKEAGDLPDLEDDAALASWLEAHPKVIERPIVVDEANDRAVVGRPPENVFELIPQ